MISKSLLELFYDAASIQRWNDHIRPGKGFTELDKQAHKMFFAYVLSKLEETDRAASINWRLLIEGGIFEFLHRIELTDIKPPIFHRLMEQKGEMVNKWVIERLQNEVGNIKGDFLEKFQAYLLDPSYAKLERRILKASHYLATNWEFQIIYNMNSNFYGLDETKSEIENEIEEHYDLAGVQKLGLEKRTRNFIDLVGQLRFQQRWAQSPRIPETSVIGHMLIVAIIAYLCTVEINGCDSRIVNNYFAGLFHDLAEVLTRDIISPVKKSVQGLDELLKSIEQIQLEEKIFPLVPSGWRGEIRYFIEDEFTSKITDGKDTKLTGSDIISEKYNKNEYKPVDGEIVRVCDHLAAYIEAYLSISNGIRHHRLLDGYNTLSAYYQGRKVAGIDFGTIFEYFTF